jgi:hypothetical protein
MSDDEDWTSDTDASAPAQMEGLLARHFPTPELQSMVAHVLASSAPAPAGGDQAREGEEDRARRGVARAPRITAMHVPTEGGAQMNISLMPSAHGPVLLAEKREWQLFIVPILQGPATLAAALVAYGVPLAFVLTLHTLRPVHFSPVVTTCVYFVCSQDFG